MPPNAEPKVLMPVFSHPDYTVALPETHTFPMHRYESVYDAMLAYVNENVNSGIKILPSRLADLEEICSVHCREYVHKFSKNQLSDMEMRKIGFPFSYDFVRRTYRITGGSLSALETILNKDNPMRVAGNLAGGTHHAFRDRGEGFCIFNDIAVCAHFALHNSYANLNNVNRVIVLDFDVHQGNGTASMLNDNPASFTFSIHGDKNYPWKTRVLGDLDVGVEDDISEEKYLETCANCLDTINEKLLQMPFDYYENSSELEELVIYQAGVDALKSDRLGRLKMSREVLKQRNEMVYEWCKGRKSCGVLLTMGGGYSFPDISDSVEAHVDVFVQANDALN